MRLDRWEVTGRHIRTWDRKSSACWTTPAVEEEKRSPIGAEARGRGEPDPTGSGRIMRKLTFQLAVMCSCSLHLRECSPVVQVGIEASPITSWFPAGTLPLVPFSLIWLSEPLRSVYSTQTVTLYSKYVMWYLSGQRQPYHHYINVSKSHVVHLKCTQLRVSFIQYKSYIHACQDKEKGQKQKPPLSHITPSYLTHALFSPYRP